MFGCTLRSLQSCSLGAIWKGHTNSKVSGVAWLAMPIIKTVHLGVVFYMRIIMNKTNPTNFKLFSEKHLK